MSIGTNLNSSYTIFKQINESGGMKFLNGLHSRSFSLNIFRMNAVALIEATLHVSDPDHGVMLMLEKNREAGQQAHRELSRHLHNFTASAMTLVDHTRVFMRKKYKETSVHNAYQREVSSAFMKDPVSQFVQGLRNFMVHRGLPNSHMFLDFKKGGEGDADIFTGIRIETASLLEWEGWNAPAREYIVASGETLDIRHFAEEYLTRIDRFHTWLENALREFHTEDLAEMRHLQRLYRASQAAEEASLRPQTQERVEISSVETPIRSERDARLVQIHEATVS